MQKTKLLSLKEIVEDAELYPRHIYSSKEWCDWQTVHKYSEALKAGAVFPPILVGRFAGNYYLIDGKHRKEMYKANKVDVIECVVKQYSSRKEMFVDAIKANVVHGRQLSSYDRAEIIVKLRKMDFTDEQISGIVSIPVLKVESFVADRITLTTSGEQMILKAPMKNLVGQEVSNDFEVVQQPFGARSQEQIVEEFLVLLETKSINTKNQFILNKLKIIRKLLTEVILSIRKN